MRCNTVSRYPRSTPLPWEALDDSVVPDLDYLQRHDGGWVWAVCDFCGHRRPIAIAPYVILWGPQASSNRLRRALHCRCGRKGCSIQVSHWVNSITGTEMWPEGPD